MTKDRRTEVLEALSQYQHRGDILTSAQAIIEALSGESDRGAVIIMCSLIEDQLLEAVLKHFGALNATQTKRLTKGGGPLRDFGSRIAMASALGIVDDDEIEILEVMKQMRNACAHSRQEITFRTPQLRDALALCFEPKPAARVSGMDNGAEIRAVFLFSGARMLGRLGGATREQNEAWIDRVIAEVMEEEAEARGKLEASPETLSDKPVPDSHQPPKD